MALGSGTKAALKSMYGLSEDGVKFLTREIGEPAAKELANQPARMADVGTRNLGNSASKSAKFIGGGAALGGGSIAGASAWGDYQQRQTQSEISDLQERRQKMLDKIANDKDMTVEDKQSLIQALEDSGAFDRPDLKGMAKGLSVPFLGEVDPMVALLVLAVLLIIFKNADLGGMR